MESAGPNPYVGVDLEEPPKDQQNAEHLEKQRGLREKSTNQHCAGKTPSLAVEESGKILKDPIRVILSFLLRKLEVVQQIDIGAIASHTKTSSSNFDLRTSFMP